MVAVPVSKILPFTLIPPLVVFPLVVTVANVSEVALPSIETPVNVCDADDLLRAIAVVPTCVVALNAAKSPVLLLAAVPNVLCANTFVPIANPKFVLAVAASVAPVPPFAIATVPVTFADVPDVF